MNQVKTIKKKKKRNVLSCESELNFKNERRKKPHQKTLQ